MLAKSINAFIAALVAALLTYLFVSNDSMIFRTVLAVAIFTFLVMLWFDRDYRYWRMANAAMGAYLCKSAFPSFKLEVVSGEDWFRFSTLKDPFDIGLVVIFAVGVVADLVVSLWAIQQQKQDNSINPKPIAQSSQEKKFAEKFIDYFRVHLPSLTKDQRTNVALESIRATTIRIAIGSIVCVAFFICGTIIISFIVVRPSQQMPKSVLTAKALANDSRLSRGLPLILTALHEGQPMEILAWDEPVYGTIERSDTSSIIYVGTRVGLEKITVKTPHGNFCKNVSVRSPEIEVSGN